MRGVGLVAAVALVPNHYLVPVALKQALLVYVQLVVMVFEQLVELSKL